jgi:hypothetical protein
VGSNPTGGSFIDLRRVEKMHNYNKWKIQEYLEKRTRSDQEERMHQILQNISDKKLSVEDMQLFFDQTTKPFDFMKRYENEMDFSDEGEAKEFTALLMEVWNQTPRTELHGKTPSETYASGEKRCELCETVRKCPECDSELITGETKTTEDEDEFTKLFCEKCNKNFQDVKMKFFPEPDEETKSLVEEIATNITKETFDEVWSIAKNEVKGLSKRELASEMFFSGTSQAFAFLHLFGVPKEMLKVWSKFAVGQGTEMEEAMKELEDKMESLERKK